MSLEFYGHPFSSYTQKVLIALWADQTPFDYRMIAPDHPENFDQLKRHSPYGMFPLLIDDGTAVFESSTIIEHLQAHHPGPNIWIPEGETGRQVRFLDRFFDLYVMGNMQKSGNDILRPEGSRDPYGADKARKDLHIAYDWLEANLGDGNWAVGDAARAARSSASGSSGTSGTTSATPMRGCAPTCSRRSISSTAVAMPATSPSTNAASSPTRV